MPLVFILANVAIVRLGRFLVGTGHDERGRALSFYTALIGTALLFLSVNGLWFSNFAGDNWSHLVGASRPRGVIGAKSALEKTLYLNTLVEPDAVVATAYAGIPGYFGIFRLVDILGYNEAHVARMTSTVHLSVDEHYLYNPGTMKFDYPYLLETYKPDVIFLERKKEFAEGVLPNMLRDAGYSRIDAFWVKTGSPRFRSGAVAPRGP